MLRRGPVVPLPCGRLSIDELRYAEAQIITYELKLAFSSVVKALPNLSLEKSEKRELKIIGSFGSVYKLRPFLDGTGILRVGGRLQNSSSDYQSKHPLLLPSEHHVTKLLITDVWSRSSRSRICPDQLETKYGSSRDGLLFEEYSVTV